MKFTSQFAVAILAAGAASHVVDVPSKVVRGAPNVVGRQIATVTGVLSDVSDGIDSLDSTVNNFSGSDDAIVKAAEDLVSTLKDGQSTIEGSDDLKLQDALGLTDPVQDLTKHAQTLTDDLKSQRSAIQKAGLCSSTRKQIGDINSASQALIKATVSKVPEDAQSIAQSLAQGITDVLNQAQSDYSESNCKDASGGDGDDGDDGDNGDGDDGSPTTTSASETSAAPTTTAASTEDSAPTTAMTTPTEHSSAGSTPMTSGDCQSTTIVPPPQGGSSTSTGLPPVATAGAANLAPAGALVAAAVAALL